MVNEKTKSTLKEKVIEMYHEGKCISSIAKKLMGKLTYKEALAFVDNTIREEN